MPDTDTHTGHFYFGLTLIKIIVDIYQQETLYFFQYIFRLDPMLDRDGGIERIFKPSEPSSEGFFI